MLKAILAATALLALSACNSQSAIEESRRNVNANLPDGCEATYAGQLLTEASSYPVIVVRCDGRETTTTTIGYRSGKTTHYATTVTFDA